MRFLPLTLVLAVLALAAMPAIGHSQTPSPSPTPQATSDIVLLTDKDSYVFGESATISIRNDGPVAYTIPLQMECHLRFEDMATGRDIQVAGHCDLIGDAQPLQPGATLTVFSQWPLDECTEPALFCLFFRPLPTGQYRISGSLTSVDRTRKSDFSKTISITGPQFTNDVKVVLAPAAGTPGAVSISLRNDGSRDYTIPGSPGCYLRFYRPDGFRFFVPPVREGCVGQPDTISPGESVTSVPAWDLGECSSVSITFCESSTPLPTGDYTIGASFQSVDNQAFSESSAVQPVPLPVLVIESELPTPVRTPAIFPELGGTPDDGGSSWINVLTALAITGGLLALATFLIARRRATSH